MNNYEKYQDLVNAAIMTGHWCNVAKKAYGDDCTGISCHTCRGHIVEWLNQEYKELQIDWSKVQVDTPIIIITSNKEYKRYFSKYIDGVVYAFSDGATSWSSKQDLPWALNSHCDNVRLANEEDIKKYSI